MGDFESGSQETISQDDYSQISKIAMALLALLGLFSPVLYSSWGYTGDYQAYIQSILWSYSIGTYSSGFSFMPFYALFSMFPFIILRLVPVAQIHRYYVGKTSRKRALLCTIIGDFYFLFMGSFIFIFYLLIPSPYASLSIPLPFQMLVGLAILLKYPIREPVTPWDDTLAGKPWWEEKDEDYSEIVKSDNDKDRLW